MIRLPGKVLLLNASYEPLGTVGVERALRLILRKENPVRIEEVVAGKTIRTAGGATFEFPSVLVLREYVNIRQKIRKSHKNRERIYIRDKFKCAYCGERFSRELLTLDHVHPKSKGGEDEATNLVTACKPCNNRKADRTPEEARMPLLTTIHEKVDAACDMLVLSHMAETRPEWKRYLFLEDSGLAVNG